MAYFVVVLADFFPQCLVGPRLGFPGEEFTSVIVVFNRLIAAMFSLIRALMSDVVFIVIVR